MGAIAAFERLPDPWAVGELKRLLDEGQYDLLIDCLKSIKAEKQGGIDYVQVELKVAECYADILETLDIKIQLLENDLKEAEAANDTSLIENLKHELGETLKIKSCQGKFDVRAALEKKHPQHAKLVEGKSVSWWTKFWKRSDVAHIPDSNATSNAAYDPYDNGE